MKHLFGAMIPLILALCSCSMGPTANEEKYDLHIKPELGTSRIVHIYERMSEEFPDRGYTRFYDTSEKYKITFTGSESPGVFDVTFEFVDYIQDELAKSSKGTTAIPSPYSNGHANQVYFSAILGDSVQMKVDQYGGVMSITGLEELRRKADDALFLGEITEFYLPFVEDPNELKKKQKERLSELMSYTRLARKVSSLLSIRPVSAVSIGEDWEHLPPTVHNLNQERYWLDTVNDVEVVLRTEVDIFAPMFGANLVGKATGRVVLERETGLVSRAHTSGELRYEESGGRELDEYTPRGAITHDSTVTFTPTASDTPKTLARLQ